VTPLPDEKTANERNGKNVTSYTCENHKPSGTLSGFESTKGGNTQKKKWLQHLNLLTSISTVVLLIVLTISEWYPMVKNVENAPENTTSVTYTNVIITPCGNYFWHSAGASGGNWLSSDIAIKHDQSLIENTLNTGVDWGYNGILGTLRNSYLHLNSITIYSIIRIIA
jgi:hypothetical protein